jgi:hypothetical protein
MPTPLAWRKAASGQPIGEVGPGSPESLARGMLSKGFPVNPGELPTSTRTWARLRPTQSDQVPGERGVPRGKRSRPSRGRNLLPRETRGGSYGYGEQSYELMVPMKVGNRRAPARGGHGTHWRDGANRLTYRRSATSPRHSTRERMSNGAAPNSRVGQARLVSTVSRPEEPAAGNPHGGVCEGWGR